MSRVTSEFKVSFGKLLIILSMQKMADYTINPYIEYATCLVSFTRAALLTEGTYEKYKDKFEESGHHMDYLYDEVLPKVNMSLWQQAETRRVCFIITNLILPIALSEGILILNEDTFNIASMMGGIKQPSDEQQ